MFFATLIQTILYIGDAQLLVEIADTQIKRAKGLMDREFLDEKEGMLFVFDRLEKHSFWMKNTKIPLSIGFFDAKKKLFQIEEMEPHSPNMSALRIYESNQPCLFALEASKDWFEKHQIAIGDTFTLLKTEDEKTKP